MEKPPRDTAELEASLRRAWEAGRAAWPGVLLPADAYMRHLAQRLPETSQECSLESMLAQLSLADLYLACACLQEVPAAVETLERAYLAKLPTMLGHLKLHAALLDDVCQKVRIHLLLGTREVGGPRLAEYTGRGALMSWIRVIAVRMALKQGGSGRETPEGNFWEEFENVPSPEPDVEFDYIKRHYRHEFRQAVHEAFVALSSEQRHLLRLHFVDRLSTSEMGPLFRVNQSTISRWLKSARQAVYEDTKRRLQERLRLSSQEFESLTNAIQSHFNVGFSQLMDEEKNEP